MESLREAHLEQQKIVEAGDDFHRGLHGGDTVDTSTP
jgi:hypothetical protein